MQRGLRLIWNAAGWRGKLSTLSMRVRASPLTRTGNDNKMHGTLGLTEMGATQGYFPGDWHVAYIDPLHMRWDRHKFRVEFEINKLGFETFAPAEEKTGIKRGRRVKIVTPAFGPYLFVRFDRQADAWGKLRALDPKDGTGISGFIDLLRNNGIPTKVPEIIVDRLKRAMEAGFFGHKPFQPGDDVEVMEGKAKGIIGKVLSVSKNYRVKILLKALGTLEDEACFMRKM